MVYRHIEPHLPEIKKRVAAFRSGRREEHLKTG
jgi:hypothetical protein